MSSRPFALFVMFYEPYPPYHGPFDDLYESGEIATNPVFLKHPAANTSLFNCLRTGAPVVPQRLSTRDSWLRLRARYHGNVKLLDNAIGIIISALRESFLWDETAVLFTSDHGDSLGDRAMLGKRAFYDEVVRVPLFIRVPWLDGTGHIPGSVSQIDVVPTLLDILDQPVPQSLQGRSRLSVLRGQDVLRDDVFMQWHGRPATVRLGDSAVDAMSAVPWRSIVTADGWKLNLIPGDQCELFNMRVDPWEELNLFDDPDERDRVRELAARIRSCQLEAGDTMALPCV